MNQTGCGSGRRCGTVTPTCATSLPSADGELPSCYARSHRLWAQSHIGWQPRARPTEPRRRFRGKRRTTPMPDSLGEYENAFWAAVGENEPAVRRFVAEHRTKPPEEWEDPREVVNRHVAAVFRAGVNTYVRKAVWHFLEAE